ncbi:MAG: MFS transporter small subunit [Pseudonocardiaceae bacterium]
MSTPIAKSVPPGSTSSGRVVVAVLAWAWVILPFLYGLYRLLIKIPALFGS